MSSGLVNRYNKRSLTKFQVKIIKMKKYSKALAGIGCWIIFTIFLVGTHNNASWIRRLDQWGYRLLQPTTVTRTRLFTIITHLGDPRLLLFLSLLICIGYGWHHQLIRGIQFISLQFIGYALVIAIKYSIQRPRPNHKLIPANGFSFPSGHTFATTVFVLAVVALLWPRLSRHWQQVIALVVAGCWIILVMASRVYLRNHFTSDVLAGLCLASGWWLLATTAWQMLLNDHREIAS